MEACSIWLICLLLQSPGGVKWCPSVVPLSCLPGSTQKPALSTDTLYSLLNIMVRWGRFRPRALRTGSVSRLTLCELQAGLSRMNSAEQNEPPLAVPLVAATVATYGTWRSPHSG